MSRLLLALTLLIAGLAHAAAQRKVTEADVDDMLRRLDHELRHRDDDIARRQAHLDSVSAAVNRGRLSINDFRDMGEAATGFDNVTAIKIFIRARDYADSIGNRRAADEFALRAAPLLPLAGFTAEAVDMLESVDTARLDLDMLRLYHDSGRRTYDYISDVYADYPLIKNRYDSLSIIHLRRLVNLNDVQPLPDETRRLVCLGEYLYLTGHHREARRTLLKLLDTAPQTSNSYAIAANILASIAAELGNDNEHIYYLALSAIADTRAATREVTSLQRLGQEMLEHDDIARAHFYLSQAMQNAGEAHAPTRMVQSASALPLIERIHNRELEASRRRIYLLIAIMAVLIILLVAALIFAAHRNRYRRRLQAHLEESNRTKENYISRFLDLSAIYMDKLDQFCKVASNKISTGQVEELYRLTRSGKFVENNASDFHAIFDEAFLHIYPDFVARVNNLMRPDARITLREGEKLNTDLRILAFMRLGIDDTARVGRILNYSVNTIYTYRNKLRNRAISRETFEADIASL